MAESSSHCCRLSRTSPPRGSVTSAVKADVPAVGTARSAVRLFHRTFHANEILANGFKDGEGTYLPNNSQLVWGVVLRSAP